MSNQGYRLVQSPSLSLTGRVSVPLRLSALVSLGDSHIPNGAAFSLLHRGDIFRRAVAIQGRAVAGKFDDHHARPRLAFFPFDLPAARKETAAIFCQRR